jgi:hypothetical protein
MLVAAPSSICWEIRECIWEELRDLHCGKTNFFALGYPKIVIVKKDETLMYFGHSFKDICAQIACMAAVAISL